MKAAMSVGRPASGSMRAALYPKPEPAPGSAPVRAYRRCPCGRRFPLYELPGRPPTHCFVHRGTPGRNRAARLAGV